MPRLTRTQKYANLREQLANSKEEKIVSQDLSSFQDRLNNVEGVLSPNQSANDYFASEKKPETNPNYIWNPFPEEIFNQPSKEIWEPVDESQFINQNQQTQAPVIEEPVVEEPIIEEPIQEIVEPIVEETTPVEIIEEAPVVEQPVDNQNDVMSDNSNVEDIFKEASIEENENVNVPAFDRPAFERTEETNNESGSYFDSFMNEPVQETKENSSDYNAYFESTKNEDSKQSFEDLYSNVFEDVKDDSGELVSLKERDTYLNQTISDVNSYNINNGLRTIDQLVDESVDSIRHPEKQLEEAESIKVVETPAYEQPAINSQVEDQFTWQQSFEKELDADKIEEPSKEDDEEFSNTVSLEISKIMDEISNAPIEEVKVDPVEKEIKESIDETIQDTITIDETINEEKAEDVVEIKNISEMEAEPLKENTMSSTIPFVVAADEDEEVLEEEEDEGGSNTVLNVILIVLIVVLVAVLGLIVFYILKTKGIF